MAGYGRWLGVGAKGFQVGGEAPAPAAAPAQATRDPKRDKQKELTPQQREILARIKAGS